jgi:transcriptional regulator with XRE-family HTH domain
MTAGSSKDEVERFTQKQQLRLGEKIKELRKLKGYTSYEEFANKHNISRAQMGRYERGKDIRFSSLVRVLSGLGMTPKEFFDNWQEW